ncbi:3-phenylpropionate/trans-cinnamate dioxygenase ferredoxin subunit [Branchiibius hedensis]|uniref:Ferredoxin subunit of nitrite reductase or a ring-hydroxylating dioxygenase n=1 Tax=Branchiibius hedensis TaxID=672460 RepID=A0A2Y8ZNX0_9MICO|nr:non-heme iron oxygenase ferredoxin subunit [Branchiibius hedensis]PWJ25216.1 3-phenylpropionate/trans-cinnamate dioxygenase ferredoxin subunit [Branchiibius hedensis]SSA34030.1 Ferredoxin subunit of nitrite reductase or a ring-hydroxylating dioxygenase [Branchiibius hedensis]
MSDFVRVCALAELTRNAPALAEIDGRPVAIVRDEDDHVHAVDDTCSHANVSLSEGEVDGCTIECWLHGSAFDLNTGEPTSLPATEPIAVYAVKVQEGDVLVDVTTSVNGVPV